MISPVASTPSAAPASTPAMGNATGADFNTFLKMLTTQLQNQDPLNPMEGTEFAVQLATFSGVEQQAQTNKLLQQMASQSGSGLAQTADWIGKEARTTAPVWFGQDPITLDIRPASRADSVQLITLNAQGDEVSREEIGLGNGEVEWLGRDAQGAKLPDGLYAFQLESIANGEVIERTDVSSYARISETRLDPRGVIMVFEGGGSATLSQITALRAPD